MRNGWIPIVIALCVVAAAPLGAADFPAPYALAKNVTDEVLAIVRADKDIQSGNQRKVLELVESKVAPHFNFARMTQLAMGRNWRQASAEQQKRLVGEFRALLIRTYTSAFTQYRNQTVEYRPLRMAPTDTDVVVQSLIRQPNGRPVAVDYGMEKTDRGWKVYNVKVEGISLVENYRNTFNTEIQKSGMDGLIKVLSEKNRALMQQAQAQ
ncbi:MAG: ABC transporter substrate-binding protein [Betaproteobacteria bacterium]|nr:ABC transporter substrate-binding protein [Betaproteobacteria bacterium]